MNNPIIYWVICGLLTLFFFFLTYKFTKTWRIWHVIFAFLVYGASIALLIYVSATYRTHNSWRVLVRDQSAQLKQLKEERDLMLYGQLTEVIQSEPSIRSATARLRRATIDRGRVWRGCTPGQAQPDDTVTVNTVAAPPPGAEAAPGNGDQNHMEENMIVYVFVEAAAPPEANLPPGAKVPAYYLGEFATANVTPTSVTLKPTLPLSQDDKIALRQGGVTWSIYEIMPVDGHRFFAVDPEAKVNLNVSADESPVFGQMDQAMLQRLMPPERLLPPSQWRQKPSAEVMQQLQDRAALLVTTYARDGRRASEDDPPENVWWKVRFTAAYEEEVDTAGDPVGAIVSSDDFFDRGRAEIALLRRGEPAKFKKGDVAVFPIEDARRLVEQDEVCEFIEPVYVRKLNDYEHGFRLVGRLMAQLAEDIFSAKRDVAETERANQRILEQTQAREKEREQLKADLAKMEYERDQITQYHERLEAKWGDLRTELSQMYRQNYLLMQELVQLDQQLTEAISHSVP